MIPSKKQSKIKLQKGQLLVVVPIAILLIISIIALFRYADPAPPNHLVISTSDGEGDYNKFALLYQEAFK